MMLSKRVAALLLTWKTGQIQKKGQDADTSERTRSKMIQAHLVYVTLTLQRRTLRLREGTWFVQGYTAAM